MAFTRWSKDFWASYVITFGLRSLTTFINKLDKSATGRKSFNNYIGGWSYAYWRPSSGVWRVFWKHQWRSNGEPLLQWSKSLSITSRPTQSFRRRMDGKLYCCSTTSNSRVFACLSHLTVSVGTFIIIFSSQVCCFYYYD